MLPGGRHEDGLAYSAITPAANTYRHVTTELDHDAADQLETLMPGARRVAMPGG